MNIQKTIAVLLTITGCFGFFLAHGSNAAQGAIAFWAIMFIGGLVWFIVIRSLRD